MATINKQMSIGEVLDIDRTTAPTDADELVSKLNDYLASKEA